MSLDLSYIHFVCQRKNVYSHSQCNNEQVPVFSKCSILENNIQVTVSHMEVGMNSSPENKMIF
jgi:hypothetical protein